MTGTRYFFQEQRGFGGPGYVRLAFCVDAKVIEGAAEGMKRAVASLKK